MGTTIDPSTYRVPGLLLLVSERSCGLCGAPLVYAEPTQGLTQVTKRTTTEVCMLPPCPMALKAKPLLDDLASVLRAEKEMRRRARAART